MSFIGKREGVCLRDRYYFKCVGSGAFALLSLGLCPTSYAEGVTPDMTRTELPKVPTEEIVVVARRKSVTDSVDRTTYNIVAGADGASLSAVDVLKRLPGVTIGPSDTITIKGGERVAYLIDGQPVRADIALAVPASQIDRVEVIANPSVDLDLGGQAIINLILKKSAKAGWSGNVSVQPDSNGGVKAGTDFARGGTGWALNGNLSFRSTPSVTRSTSETDYTTSTSANEQNQMILDQKRTNRISAEIKMYKKAGGSEFSLAIGGNYNVTSDLANEMVSDSGHLSEDHYRSQNEFHGFYPYLNFFLNEKLGGGFSIRTGLDVYGGLTRSSANTSDAIDQFAEQKVKFAYIEPTITIEEAVFNGTISAEIVYSANPVGDRLGVSGSAVSGSSLTEASNFAFDRQQVAGVLSYDGTIANFEVKPALRFETISQVFSVGPMILPGLRNYKKLLPSLAIARKIGKKNEIKLSFTSRVEIPDAMELDPFDNYKTPFQIDRGNTFLRPSDKKQIDFSYSYTGKAVEFSHSFYYRNTKDDVSPYSINDSSDSTIQSFVNAGSSLEYGYSFTYKIHLGKNLQFGSGLDLFHKVIVAPLSLEQLGRVHFIAMNINSSVDFTLDQKDHVSEQFSYQGRTVGLGTDVPRFFTSEIKLSRSLSKKISLAAYLEDIFVPLGQRSIFYGVGLTGNSLIRQNSRLFRVSLSSAF